MKLLFLALFPFIVFGCKNVSERENFTQKKNKQFPVIVDTLKLDSIIPVNVNKMYHGEHNVFYIGKEKDTIEVGEILKGLPPLPSPIPIQQKRSIAKPKVIKKKHFKYFKEWTNRGTYVSKDSVKLKIKVDTNQIINNGFKLSYPVFIKNIDTDTCYIGYGRHIPIEMQAFNCKNEWRNIEEKYTYGCGMGIDRIILPENEILITTALIYSGNFKTKLRLKFGNNYSNEFYGTINEGQFIESY